MGAGSRLKTRRVKSLGGEEAEGFEVGVHDREPTPALRATPGRGFSDGQRSRCKIQVASIALGSLGGKDQDWVKYVCV
jgi:hypothetical protein